MMKAKKIVLGLFLTGSVARMLAVTGSGAADARISLKVPGNDAVRYHLTSTVINDSVQELTADGNLPVKVRRAVSRDGGKERVSVTITAIDDICFNYGERINTGYIHETSQMLMPGFWYRQNQRSPESAPCYSVSDSWTVREDRLSSPLTAIYSPVKKEYMTVMRVDPLDKDALTQHRAGEVILSGETSIGYTGFENVDGEACLSYGFPYCETPKSYTRKLTLNPPIYAFQYLPAGEQLTINWELKNGHAEDYADCVSATWQYCYDTKKPAKLENAYSIDEIKDNISNFFIDSYVGDKPLKYYSGVELRTETCEAMPIAEVGFVGRTLLNAFNALEYGEANSRPELVGNATAIFGSYLENGFSPKGLMKEKVHFNRENQLDRDCSIRRQSEGVYAMLSYLDYEKKQGRRHPEWENKIKGLLDLMLTLQNEDGSFPRKFDYDLKVIDASGGSTPSATLPLVMGYKYFNDKRYLESARRTIDYLDRELISKSDYFSSTLDANCEDKEASLYASTAAYYMALVTKGAERRRCIDLSRRAAYFAATWYYTWDVPFARGQMLGDVNLKTRGWGNVSTENNHIDVFVFEFADVLRWLSREGVEPRFGEFADVISSSMGQLLPYESHMCGIAKKGFYPEVVQHTNWDYGKNGKGFYNDIFAPGWTVASLWQLYTPGRAEAFLTSGK